MNGLLRIGTEYMKQSDWKDLALIKFCLCSMGVLIGIALPKKARTRGVLIAIPVFIVTFIPLMHKLFRIIGLTKCKRQNRQSPIVGSWRFRQVYMKLINKNLAA